MPLWVFEAAKPDYGSLAPLVKGVGILVSVGAALTLSFRGRAKWEPIEQDVPKGPAKVASLFVSVGTALIWTQMANKEYEPTLVRMAAWMAVIALAFLIAYGALISIKTYTRIVTIGPDKAVEQKIIGGFVLTPSAKEKTSQKDTTIQKAFAGGLYDADLIWTRPSIAAAKAAFVLCYIGLTAAGVGALTCAGMVYLLHQAT